MTESDDGEFQPHHGDPWHPGWSNDAESGEEIDAAGADDSAKPESNKEEGERGKKKKKRRGRRHRRADAGSATGFDVDPTDASDPDVEPHDDALPLGDDPFDAVLEREGRVSRYRPADEDEAPPPAWTIDPEPASEQMLPVEQPSWVGRETGGTPGVEAVGFEPVVESGDAGASDEAPGPDLDSLAAAFAAQEASKTDHSDRDMAGADAAELLDTGEAADQVGEHGVAGPEAFDALKTDDATGELDDWEAFTDGSSPEPLTGEQPEQGPPGRPLSKDAADEWVVSEPKKRRRFFGRGKRGRVDEIIDDGVMEIAWDDEIDGSAAVDAEAYDTDEQRVGDSDPDDLAGFATVEGVAAPTESIGEAGLEPVAEPEGVEAAIAEALEALESSEVPNVPELKVSTVWVFADPGQQAGGVGETGQMAAAGWA